MIERHTERQTERYRQVKVEAPGISDKPFVEDARNGFALRAA
jgi:hypothetical protein